MRQTNLVVLGPYPYRVGAKDLTIVSINKEEDGKSFKTMDEALKSGTKMFDALRYFSLPETMRPLIKYCPLAPGTTLPTRKDIALSFAYLYLFLLYLGRPPNDDDAPPKFIIGILGAGNKPKSYTDVISSFNPRWMKHTWIRDYAFSAVNKLIRYKSKLPIAGYKYIHPFKLYTIKEDATIEVRHAFTAVINLLNKGPLWDIHPITRSEEFIRSIPSLSKNLIGLIFDTFTPEQIQDMKDKHLIHKDVYKNFRYASYKTWTED
ncbi:hypothetical protein BDF14DRAFT_1858583 [Spinellus fusiger]|nr:hypothetical protein BDF14DRAFT_1858583 [Spinellus fusiger]